MIDPSPFGRPRDDRGPLAAGLAAAVVLHVAAIFVPLPQRAVPDVPPPDSTGPRVTHVIPAPPDRHRERDPLPARTSRIVPLPATFDDDSPVLRPESVTVAPDAEAFDVPAGWDPGVEVPAPPAGHAILPVDTSGLVPPEPIEHPKPDYPQAGLWTGASARVVLSAVIDRDGAVTGVEVLSVTRPGLGFGEAAAEAVRRWTYRPGELHGRPVAVRLTVEVTFSLN